jgi:4-oxalocrotonate tautomerase
MPYVNVRITRDKASAEQKLEIIRRMTNVLVEVLGKDPATTFVVIDEVEPENWGVAGTSVAELRAARARQGKK